MQLLVRFLNFLNVVLGKISAPLYSYFAKLPRKPLPALNEPGILNSSATTLAEKIRTKELTSEQVVKAFIERCQQVNGQLNAIIEDRFEAALEDARNVDRLIRSNEKPIEQLAKEKPLLGVPVTFKECLMVKGLSYTAGAQLRKGVKATEDGDAVAALRNAGAIPIAVTNLPELCCSYETRSDIIGYTNNPYDPNLTSGGSSGGEGALVSAAGSVIGIGSDFGGSIRVPSFYCGLFGHRPTSGIVSLTGHFPNSPDETFQKTNSIGPFCRYAEDLKLALAAMAGVKEVASLNLDQKVNLSELRIYYMLDRGFKLSEISVDPDIKKVILKAVKHLRSTHECFVQKINIAEMDDALEMIMTKATQMKDVDSVLVLKDPKNESSLLSELLKLFINKASYSMELLMMRFNAKACFFWIPENKRPEYLSAANNLANRLKELLKEDGVLFYPTFASLAFYKQQSLWKMTSMAYPMIVNILGFPATHVPMGLNANGIPVGFQVIAAPNQDRLCFAVAEELQKAFGGWVPPPMSS
ncbi:fatty-acid amide hydrolase 2-A-like [Planococcus citri]|uniref:fatty-acid amide hydrolase 2-A-like n=1 Tax=Planococcus citri TaxID=170843 RepID=UPI0031F9BEF7